MNEGLADKDMGQLVELLIQCEADQNKIYADYRAAADRDLSMRPLKDKEKLIRTWISARGGFS